MSDYGHDGISCMTYDIHVDILLGCVFVMRPLHVHLDGSSPYRSHSLLGFAHPLVGPPFRYRSSAGV